MSERKYFVYIMTNIANTVLYTGMTNNLIRRIAEHKTRKTDGFTQKYRVSKLIYFEETDYLPAAIEREKQIKSWRKEKKIALIESQNPDWTDLFNSLLD